MKIGIISDTHNRYEAVERALELLDKYNVELLIHCGDIEDADTVWLFPGKTHFVFGNCDTERASLRQAMYGIGATLHEPFGRLELDGVRLAFIHGDAGGLVQQLWGGGEVRLLLHGRPH